jgi:hypothetical protein
MRLNIMSLPHKSGPSNFEQLRGRIVTLVPTGEQLYKNIFTPIHRFKWAYCVSKTLWWCIIIRHIIIRKLPNYIFNAQWESKPSYRVLLSTHDFSSIRLPNRGMTYPKCDSGDICSTMLRSTKDKNMIKNWTRNVKKHLFKYNSGLPFA